MNISAEVLADRLGMMAPPNPEYYFNETIKFQAWDSIRNIGMGDVQDTISANIRPEHFSTILRAIHRERDGHYMGGWTYLGVLDEPSKRPAVDAKIGECKYPWSGLFVVHGEWQDCFAYARVNGVPSDREFPSVGYVCVADRMQGQGIGGRLMKLLNVAAFEVYGQTLQSRNERTKAGERLHASLERTGFAEGGQHIIPALQPLAVAS